MNRLILLENELSSPSEVKLSGRRADHIRSTISAKAGDKIRFGMLNGKIGTATLVEDNLGSMSFVLVYSEERPLGQLPCTLVLALPRPKVAKRIIQAACTLGVEELHLINSSKVEKSYWQSHYLKEESLEAQIMLGLEQSGSTLMPKVVKHSLFRPFTEDILPVLCNGKRALLAHPYASVPCPAAIEEPSVLVIGPEGGFTEFEVGLLESNGAQAVSLGSRILRVETAIPYILGRLYL